MHRSRGPTAQVRIGAAAYLGVQVSDSSAAVQSPYGDQYGFGGSLSGAGDPTGGSTVAGAAVVGVESGTPAAAAGLATGDVITGVGSTTIGSATDLTSALSGHQPGDQVTISWIDSSGTRHSATVTLGSSPIN